MVAEKKPKLKFVKVEKLELWEDANVRKAGAHINIAELAGNIKKNGLRVPLLTKQMDGKFLVFSGQRRLLACQIAKIIEVPCFVFTDIKLTDARVLSLSENLYREAMTREDRSKAAQILFGKFKDIKRVAVALGVSESTVKKYFIYDAIPEDLKKFAMRGAGLSTKQVSDIYMKFPDIDSAIAVAKRLSKIENREEKRKMHAVIRRSAPSDNLATIEKKTKKLFYMKEYKINLADNDFKTIEKIAYQRRIDEEDLLVDIVEDWITEYHEGYHR